MRYDKKVQIETPFGMVEIVYHKAQDTIIPGLTTTSHYVATVVEKNQWNGWNGESVNGSASALKELMHEITSRLSFDLIREVELSD